VRTRIAYTGGRPRLSLFRSGKYMHAQLIDDEARKTLVSGSTRGLKKNKETKTELAALLGAHLAERAKALGLTKIVLDRGSYKYHGRLKALAEAMRKSGLQF
jgi:large subunit ribosomal protein L18